MVDSSVDTQLMMSVLTCTSKWWVRLLTQTETTNSPLPSIIGAVYPFWVESLIATQGMTYFLHTALPSLPPLQRHPLAQKSQAFHWPCTHFTISPSSVQPLTNDPSHGLPDTGAKGMHLWFAAPTAAKLRATRRIVARNSIVSNG